MSEPTPEFDRYAANYKDLLREPIRDMFSPDPHFYTQRKWLLIQDFFRRRKLPVGQLRWLDVGCGEGDLLRHGIGSFAHLAGCDPSPGMLSSADGFEVRPQADSEKLPFDDCTFDFVTAVCVFHHVDPPSRPALLKEVLRVLTPGGIACIIEHNAYNPLVRGMVRRIRVDEKAILLTPFETRSLLERTGLAAIATEFFLYLPQPLFRWFGAAEALGRKLPIGGQYASFAQRPF